MKRLLHNSVWSNRDLRLVALAQGTTFLAGEVVVVALLLHAVAVGWGSAGAAAVLVATTAPLAVGGLLAGPLVDRASSRRLGAGAAAWQGVVAAAVGAALWWGAHEAVLLAGVVLVACGQAVAGTTWAALLPSVVAPQELSRAVGASQAVVMVLGMLGPVLAGAAAALGDAATASLVAAGLFGAVGVLALAVRTVRDPREPRTLPSSGAQAPRGPGGAQAQPAPERPRALDGLRTVAAEPVVRAFVVGFVAFVLAVEMVSVVLVVLVRDDLGGSELDYGLLGSLLAAGLVVGVLAAGRLGVGARLVRGAVVGAAGMSLALVAGGLAPDLLVLGVALVVLGVFNGVVNTSAQTTLALRVRPEERGRVLGTTTSLLRTASVVGLVAGGAVGGLVPAGDVLLWAGGAGLLVTAWLARALWWRRDLEPAAAPAPAAVAPGPAAVAPASAAAGALVQADEVVDADRGHRLGDQAEVEVCG